MVFTVSTAFSCDKRNKMQNEIMSSIHTNSKSKAKVCKKLFARYYLKVCDFF